VERWTGDSVTRHHRAASVTATGNATAA